MEGLTYIAYTCTCQTIHMLRMLCSKIGKNLGCTAPSPYAVGTSSHGQKVQW
jgi:hypothetical protein